MTTSTDRQTFRQLVAAIAAKAKAKLPEQVNGRIESAVKLVLAHDVLFLEDGTVEVGSASDPLKTYTLAGHACDCQDFAYGQAPEGWCQHRIAAGIAKRVHQLLPVAPEGMEVWPDNDFEDAPQSTPVETEPPTPAPASPPGLARGALFPHAEGHPRRPGRAPHSAGEHPRRIPGQSGGRACHAGPRGRTRDTQPPGPAQPGPAQRRGDAQAGQRLLPGA